MAAIFQTTFSNAFSWMKMFKFLLRFHWSLFPRVQLTIFQHWFRFWLGTDQATSHYLNQWWLDYRRIYASLGLNELKQWSSFWEWWVWPRRRGRLLLLSQSSNIPTRTTWLLLGDHQLSRIWRIFLPRKHQSLLRSSGPDGTFPITRNSLREIIRKRLSQR